MKLSGRTNPNFCINNGNIIYKRETWSILCPSLWSFKIHFLTKADAVVIKTVGSMWPCISCLLNLMLFVLVLVLPLVMNFSTHLIRFSWMKRTTQWFKKSSIKYKNRMQLLTLYKVNYSCCMQVGSMKIIMCIKLG